LVTATMTKMKAKMTNGMIAPTKETLPECAGEEKAVESSS